MILSKQKIASSIDQGSISIDPFSYDRLNPNSYNLTLADELITYDEAILDSKKDNKFSTFKIPEEGIIIKPGKLYLGSTEEITFTDEYVPMIEGRSSLARLGLFVHITAGFGDVGFNGRWTLEISAIQPIRIYSGMEVCQIYFLTLDGDIELYNGKYQKQQKTTPSLLFKEY